MKQTTVFRHFRFDVWIFLNAIWGITGLLFLKWNPEMLILAYVFETFTVAFFLVVQSGLIYLFNTREQEQINQSIRKSYSESEQKTVDKIHGFRIISAFYKLIVTTVLGLVPSVFTWGQSILIFLMISGIHPEFKGSPGNWTEDVITLMSYQDFRQAFTGIAVFNFMCFMRDFVLPKQYLTQGIKDIVEVPFKRIFVQQMLVIGGGLLFFVYNTGFLGVAVLLMVLKMVIDSVIWNKR